MSPDHSSEPVPKAVAAQARKTIAAKKGRMEVAAGQYDTTTLHWIYGHALKTAARKMEISSKDLDALDKLFTALKPKLTEEQVEAVEHMCWRVAGLLVPLRTSKGPKTPRRGSTREYLEANVRDWRKRNALQLARELQKTKQFADVDPEALRNRCRDALRTRQKVIG